MKIVMNLLFFQNRYKHNPVFESSAIDYRSIQRPNIWLKIPPEIVIPHSSTG